VAAAVVMSDRAAISSITRVTGGVARTDQDLVAVEAPLSVILHRGGAAPATRALGVLMRTPGDDEELALGLLHSEGIVRRRDDVRAIRLSPAAPGVPLDASSAVVDIDLADTVALDDVAGRALPSTSACGLCGRLEVQTLTALAGAAIDRPQLDPTIVSTLPNALRAAQSVFAETGGLHAAGLFAVDGRCLAVREDVGRHNAVDKVIGWALDKGRLPARETILAVSGRVAFEIVQKAALAGIPAIVAVGAPSSLAVEAARAAHLTLIGFVRDDRFNVYTGHERIGS
jgi:FdhD protein